MSLDFFSKKKSPAKVAPPKPSKKPPVVVVHKGDPSPKILRPEKETEVQSHIEDIAPDFQGREPLRPKSNPTDQSIPRNSKASMLNFMEGKLSDELFEERIQEIDRHLGKFDTNGESFLENQWGKNKENILETLTTNERASSTKVYSRAHPSPLSTHGSELVLSDITNNPKLNTGRWK